MLGLLQLGKREIELRLSKPIAVTYIKPDIWLVLLVDSGFQYEIVGGSYV